MHEKVMNMEFGVLVNIQYVAGLIWVVNATRYCCAQL